MFEYKNPLHMMPSIPVGEHYGAFGVKRKYERHCGVDLYCDEGESVFPIEPGIITEINWFTGPETNTPWWNSTRCVCIEGDSGIIVYGEIQEDVGYIKVGDYVSGEGRIGEVKRVLKKDKGKPTSMLHVSLLTHGFKEAHTHSWKLDDPKPHWLLDPTPILIQTKINDMKRRYD
ncbi:M23 family metallopeptidase [Patescibacteria group bacterium]|nr:M23 family metallopeptidase [Patescibacteria group bacterium]